MSANKIAETSTTAGAGNLTLAGAWSVPDSFITGNRTFNSFYGLNHRFPYMIQDKLGNWEKGVGYLSGTAVLVRETVVDNSLSTTALINFPAGEKLVMVPTDAGMDILPKLRDGAAYAGSAFVMTNGSTHTSVANRLCLTPFLLKRPFAGTAIVCPITTPAASTKARLGIYQITQVDTTHTASLLQDFGEVATDMGIDKELSINLKLAAGLYFLAYVSNGAPIVRGQLGSLDMALGGLTSAMGVNNHGFFKTGLTSAVDGLPSTVTFSSSEISVNTIMPRLLCKGSFL